MRRQGTPQINSRGRKEEQESAQPAEPVVAQQSGIEPSEQDVPPGERQDITPVQERENEGQPEDQGAGLEADLQELSLIKTGGKKADDPDVKGEFVTSLEPTQVPEAGEGQPEV